MFQSSVQKRSSVEMDGQQLRELIVTCFLALVIITDQFNRSVKHGFPLKAHLLETLVKHFVNLCFSEISL